MSTISATAPGGPKARRARRSQPRTVVAKPPPAPPSAKTNSLIVSILYASLALGLLAFVYIWYVISGALS